MEKFFKQKEGITLIALVITIIVLLILAGISISMLSGDNSILQRATDAKQISERAEAKEQAQMDIMAYIADKTANHQDASLDDDKVKEILSDNKSYVKEAGDTSFTTKKGEYEIPYSELYNKSTNDTSLVDWDSLFSDAKANPEEYKHPDQQNTDRIAFDTNGKLVNLDLWNIAEYNGDYIIQGSEEWVPGGGMAPSHVVSPGYKGTINEDGRIQGEMPMYVQSDDKSRFIPIVSMEYTFIGIDNLKYCPTIPSSVTSIGTSSFYGCTKLENIIIPSTVNTIGMSAFWNCSSLENLVIPNSITSIGSMAFHGDTKLTGITIPNGVRIIGSGAFMSCEKLTHIVIPNGVTSIENNTFSGCDGLVNLTIPNSVTTIGMHAFSGCYGLTSLIIPNSVTHIGYEAFLECGGFDITIPSSVTQMEAQVFKYCYNSTVRVPFKENDELPERLE